MRLDINSRHILLKAWQLPVHDILFGLVYLALLIPLTAPQRHMQWLLAWPVTQCHIMHAWM